MTFKYTFAVPCGTKYYSKSSDECFSDVAEVEWIYDVSISRVIEAITDLLCHECNITPDNYDDYLTEEIIEDLKTYFEEEAFDDYRRS